MSNDRQESGYAILKRPGPLFATYSTSKFARDSAETLAALRQAVGFLNPQKYRGISREPLSPYPSLDEDIIKAFRDTGGDMDLEAAARRRFREIIGESPSADDDYDEDLLQTLEQAKEIFSLLNDKQGYEIVRLLRDSFEEIGTSLGFDIGYWGGDHFSIICDCVVMPLWHPPDPADFKELAERLRRLNNHVLFRTASDAEAFKAYYASKSWAESETYEGQICLIRVDQVGS